MCVCTQCEEKSGNEKDVAPLLFHELPCGVDEMKIKEQWP